jgi:hypothetical protein
MSAVDVAMTALTLSTAGAFGLLAPVTTPAGWFMLAAMATVPPLAFMRYCRRPVQTMSESSGGNPTIAAAPRDAAGPRAGDGAACPRCGTAPEATTLLTSMTRYYACGSCEARWSVARSPLPVSIPPTP